MGIQTAAQGDWPKNALDFDRFLVLTSHHIGGGVATARIGLRLSAKQLTELESARACSKKERKFDKDLRLRVIILVGNGITMRVTARTCEVGMTTVKRWIGRFTSGGITQLLTKGP